MFRLQVQGSTLEEVGANMVSKRKIEEVVVGESIMRMAARIKESTMLDDRNLPPSMPDSVKDMIREATPVALSIVRLSELSKWN